MHKRIIISIILIIITLLIALLGYFILPDQVIIQFSAGSSENSTAPKLLALLVPTILGIGGAITSFFTKDDKKAFGKGVLVSVVGICVGIFMIAVNSFMQ